MKVELEKNRFSLGSIAPDAYLPSKQYKMISHFANKGNGSNIDGNAFLEKYNNRLNDSFYLGYYCHLLSDKLWFSKYNKKLQSNRQHYEDYDRLTKILIRYYKLENNFSFFDDFLIQEIDMNVFRHIFEELNSDFIFEKEIPANTLEMFEVEDIENYIEEAVKLSVNSIKAMVIR